LRGTLIALTANYEPDHLIVEHAISLAAGSAEANQIVPCAVLEVGQYGFLTCGTPTTHTKHRIRLLINYHCVFLNFYKPYELNGPIICAI